MRSQMIWFSSLEKLNRSSSASGTWLAANKQLASRHPVATVDRAHEGCGLREGVGTLVGERTPTARLLVFFLLLLG
jgi:hypothetical protein